MDVPSPLILISVHKAPLSFQGLCARTAAVRFRWRVQAVPVLAVLDFQNVSDDRDADWLGTGLAETLTADLKGSNW